MLLSVTYPLTIPQIFSLGTRTVIANPMQYLNIKPIQKPGGLK